MRNNKLFYTSVISLLLLGLSYPCYSDTLDGLSLGTPENNNPAAASKSTSKEIKLNPINDYLRNAEEVSLPLSKKIKITKENPKVAFLINPPKNKSTLWNLKLSTVDEAAMGGALKILTFDKHKRLIKSRSLIQKSNIGSTSLSSLVWPDEPVYLLVTTNPHKNAELSIQAQKSLPKLEEEKNYHNTFQILSEKTIKKEVKISWKVKDTALQQYPWKLQFSSALGTRYQVQIRRKGHIRVTGETDKNGQLIIKNWRPNKDDFEFVIKPLSKQSSAIFLSLEPIKEAHEVLERELEKFTPATLEKQLTGSLSHKTSKNIIDKDIWQIDLSKAKAGTLSHIQLSISSDDPSHQLRLSLRPSKGYDKVFDLKQQGEINLATLSLMPDKYRLEVSSEDVGVDYILQIKTVSAPSKIQEHEPNDSIEYANAIIARRPIKGQLSKLDKQDYFKLDTNASGEAQLWRFIATGKGVEKISIDKKYTAERNPKANSQPVSFKHILLLPGVHIIKLTGDGVYTFRAIPLGPPKPGFEVEPNDGKHGPIQRLSLGEKIIGSLEQIRYGNTLDEDKYRFTIEEKGNYRITITPPEDQGISAELKVYNSTWFDAKLSTNAATPLIYESNLFPADYIIEVKNISKQYALDEYSVLLEKISDNKQIINADIEPNDRAGFATRLTQSQTLTGSLGNFDQADYFTLPASTKPSTIKVSAIANKNLKFEARLFDEKGGNMYLPVRPVAPNSWTIKPHKKDIYFELKQKSSKKSYINTRINYTLDLAIEANSSSYKTHVKGLKVLPEQFKGKINIAWSGLGAKWQTTKSNKLSSSVNKRVLKSLAVLNDYVIPHGSGNEWRKHDTPSAFQLQLATNKPVLLEGIALNTRMIDYPIDKIRRFDFLTSNDGEAFDLVFSGELDSSHKTHYFPFDKAIKARYIQLVPTDTFSGRVIPIKYKAQELMVFAKSPFTLPSVDLSSYKLGGHVVYQTFKEEVTKKINDPLDAVLIDPAEANKKPLNCEFGKGKKQAEWVIGLHHNRIAQLKSIKYKPDSKAQSDTLFDNVVIQMSNQSPLGPWVNIGEWNNQQLQQAQEIPLEKNTWVKFIRFIVKGKEKINYACPQDIIVLEQSNDENYQSILAEWGGDTATGPYEKTHPIVKKKYPPLGGKDQKNANKIFDKKEVFSSVKRERNDDWFVFQKTKDTSKNTVTIQLSHPRSFKPFVHIFDDKGETISLEIVEKNESNTSNSELPLDWIKSYYQFILNKSETYSIRIQEPPRNTVISWDASGSMELQLPYIHSSIQEWASYLQPKHEQVKIHTFKGKVFPKKNWANYPYMLQSALELARNNKKGSSDAESSLIQSSELLFKEEGNRAVVMTSDAIAPRDRDLWPTLQRNCPQIYGAGIGGGWSYFANLTDSNFIHWQDNFQDWTSACGGKYQYCDSFKCLEDFYSFVAEDIRKPKPYAIQLESIYTKPAAPGSFSVSIAKKSLKKTSKALYVILDASGSMLKKIDGKYRINIAKQTLKKLVETSVGTHNQFGLRTFGLKSKKCHHELTLPVTKLNIKRAKKAIEKIRAISWAKTPIADSLIAAAQDLESFKGEKLIVLLTDGKETCGGDSEAVLKSLRASGINIKMYIVGFAIDDKNLVDQFKNWASLGGGKYYDAQNQSDLQKALNQAVTPSFEVKNKIGDVIFKGFVGDKKIELPVGKYTVLLPDYPQIIPKKMKLNSGENILLEFD